MTCHERAELIASLHHVGEPPETGCSAGETALAVGVGLGLWALLAVGIGLAVLPLVHRAWRWWVCDA